MTRFADFIKSAYGADTLEENLRYIVDALSARGSSTRSIIRNYFIKDFYTNHVKIYKSAPSTGCLTAAMLGP